MRIERIIKLTDLLESRYFESYRESVLGNDLFINDPERADRIHKASEFGTDGSTHGEVINDWRNCLDCLAREIEIPDEIRESIDKEIDNCEQWHIDNGSIDNQGM